MLTLIKCLTTLYSCYTRMYDVYQWDCILLYSTKLYYSVIRSAEETAW